MTTNPNDKSVFLAKYHDITPFASSDANRYAIQGVNYNADKGRLEATDGAMAIRVPVQVNNEAMASFPAVGSDVGKSGIIPAATLKRGLSNIPKTGMPEIQHARLSVNGKVTITATDLDQEQAVSSKPIDGNYPNLDMVWPTAEPVFSITLPAMLLKRLASYAESVGLDKDGKGVPIKLEFTDALSAARASFSIQTPLGDCVKAEAILMPMKMQ